MFCIFQAATLISLSSRGSVFANAGSFSDVVETTSLAADRLGLIVLLAGMCLGFALLGAIAGVAKYSTN